MGHFLYFLDLKRYFLSVFINFYSFYSIPTVWHKFAQTQIFFCGGLRGLKSPIGLSDETPGGTRDVQIMS